MHGPGDAGFFRRIAPLYDLFMPGATPADFAAGLARAERPIERVVDLGGGTGRAALALRALEGDSDPYESVDPLVVDVTVEMLARARGRGLDALLGDAGRLPLRENGVDAVIVADALHHFPDHDAAIEEVARVLRPGGVLVVREFDPGHPLGWLLAVGERALGMESEFLTPTRLAAIVAGAGLEPQFVDFGFGYTVVGVAPAGSTAEATTA